MPAPVTQTLPPQISPENPGIPIAEHASTEADMEALTRQFLIAVYEQPLQDGQAFAALGLCPELGWLAQCAANAPLPAGWQKCSDAGQCSQAFFNSETSEVQDALPNMSDFVRLGRLAMHARQKPAEAGRAVAWVNEARDDALRQAWHAQEGWSGPHMDTSSGVEYYHKAATGASSWGSPSAAPAYIAHVANGLLKSEAFPKDVVAKPELLEESWERPQSEPQRRRPASARARVTVGDGPPDDQGPFAQSARAPSQRANGISSRVPSVRREQIQQAPNDHRRPDSSRRRHQRGLTEHEEAAFRLLESPKRATHDFAATPEQDPAGKAHVFDLYTDRSHCESVSSVYGGSRGNVEKFVICTPREQSVASIASIANSAPGMNEHAVTKLAEAAAAVAAAAAALAGAGQANVSSPLVEAQMRLHRAFDPHAADSSPDKLHDSVSTFSKCPPGASYHTEPNAKFQMHPSTPRRHKLEASAHVEVQAAATPPRKHGTSGKAKLGWAASASAAMPAHGGAAIDAPRPKLEVNEVWSPDGSAADSFEICNDDGDKAVKADIWSPDSSIAERELSVPASPQEPSQNFEPTTPPRASPTVTKDVPATGEVDHGDDDDASFAVSAILAGIDALPDVSVELEEPTASPASVAALEASAASHAVASTRVPAADPMVANAAASAVAPTVTSADALATAPALLHASVPAAELATAPEVPPEADSAVSPSAADPVSFPVQVPTATEVSVAPEAHTAAQVSEAETHAGPAVAVVSGVTAHAALDRAPPTVFREAPSMRDPRGLPSNNVGALSGSSSKPLRGLRTLPPSLAPSKAVPATAAASAPAPAAAPEPVPLISAVAAAAPKPTPSVPTAVPLPPLGQLVSAVAAAAPKPPPSVPTAVPSPPLGPPPNGMPQPPAGPPTTTAPAPSMLTSAQPVASKQPTPGPFPFPFSAPPVSPRVDATPPQSARSGAGLRKVDAGVSAGASAGYPRAGMPLVGGA